MAVRAEFVRQCFAVAELCEPQIRILVYGEAVMASRLAGDQTQSPRQRTRICLFSVGRLGAGFVRLYPDLQEVNRILFGRIVFAMQDAGASGDVLELARLD